MEKYLLIVAGAIALYFSGRLFVDLNFARKYVLKSPQAYIWRKILGSEKTLKLVRHFFAPAGVALGLVLIVLSLTYLQ